MRFYVIDYFGVTGNKQDGWKVGNSRIGRKKFCCRSTRRADILNAMHRWGVIPNSHNYKVVDEGGQLTIFHAETERPMCAIFKTGG